LTFLRNNSNSKSSTHADLSAQKGMKIYFQGKVHPQSGYDILKDVELPYPIAEIVLQHHERTDGSGCPNGLKGDRILIEVRIIAVADVVEAISSHCPYRPAKGIDVALEEIENNAGVLYDREVVRICLKLFREDGFRFE